MARFRWKPDWYDDTVFFTQKEKNPCLDTGLWKVTWWLSTPTQAKPVSDRAFILSASNYRRRQANHATRSGVRLNRKTVSSKKVGFVLPISGNVR
jgi:hypothetical protein